MTTEALVLAPIRRALDRMRGPAMMPIVVCFDVEPDARAVAFGDPAPWHGFEELIDQVPSLRRRLSHATRAPVVFTWCLRMDPQVAQTWGSAAWVVDHYRDAFAQLEAAGDELGVHPHPFRWDRENGAWMVDHQPDWTKHCLTTALDAFEESFGKPCLVHRAGDTSLSSSTLECLQARGVRIDLSVEPGVAAHGGLADNEGAIGLTADFRGAPTGPYRSNPTIFPAPDPANRADPILVPLLSARGFKGRRGPLLLGARPNRFATRLLGELLQGRPPVLAFAVRSNAATASDWHIVVKNLEHLARHKGARFITAGAAADHLGERSRDR